MVNQSFQQDLEEAASRNGLRISRGEAIVAAIAPEATESVINVFGGGPPKPSRELLVVTSLATYHVSRGAFSIKARWVVWHEDLEGVGAVRGMAPGGYVIDQVVLEQQGGRQHFQVGFSHSSPMGEVEREIAASNAQVAVEEIEAAASRGGPSAEAPPAGSSIQFDPRGPEEAGEAAERAYGQQEWMEALGLFVKAVDRLHDFYVYEQFRNRQPSPADAWLVQGVTKSLGVTREVRPEVDVTALVREATHRLRTISTAVANAGGEPVLYRRALDEMARLAPDIDVSGIFWE